MKEEGVASLGTLRFHHAFIIGDLPLRWRLVFDLLSDVVNPEESGVAHDKLHKMTRPGCLWHQMDADDSNGSALSHRVGLSLSRSYAALFCLTTSCTSQFRT